MSRALGIIGFGTVGSGVYETMLVKKKEIEKLTGEPFRIPVVLVNNKDKQRQVNDETVITDSFDELLQHQEIDTVVESVPDAETAYPYVKELLANGKTVITANKELIATHGEELLALASENGCRLFFEAAVAGGIPVLASIRHTLKTNDIKRVEGVLNGTSNFILTKMRDEGTPFGTALEEAQENGYAEAVPDKDIDGWDAWFKTVILSRWIYGRTPLWQTHKPGGIRGTDVRDLQLAEAFEGRLKHVASIKQSKGKVTASVEASLVLKDHPLYGVEGVNNGIHLEGSIVGSLLFQGAGAGKYPTASAIVEELVNYWSATCEAEPEFYGEAERTEDDAEYVDKTNEVWLVTGKQLGLQLDGQKDIKSLSAVIKIDGREAIVVKGERKTVTETMTKVNDSVTVYPVKGAEESSYGTVQLNKHVS